MGIQKTPYQKTYKLQVGCQEFTVDFDGCKRQLDWLESLWFLIKTINIQQYTIAIMPSAWPGY